ncbi:unnamed protein product [Toxocara canis]|uniref:Ig-like domain-containing protein n=1 Tax=Toxocara canis TaxID=6265 RepID=A0A3P7GYQ5_TOXCA|nr:unnamed protein product [Toxocara canis]
MLQQCFRYVTKSLSNGLSTLRIEPVRLSDGNSTISCSADNGVGSPVVADAHLTVLPIESLPPGFPVIEAHPVLKSVEQGRTAHVSCRVRGDPRPKVLWLRDLMPIDVRSNSRYSVSTLGNPGAITDNSDEKGGFSLWYVRCNEKNGPIIRCSL